MTPLKEVTPPEILYHYTSQAGLMGILSSRQIWASKIHYLNDSLEFAFALDLARSELKRRMETTGSENEHLRLETLLDETETIANVNICVASFSELGDSLSQWRGYCARGSGYSIGFETRTLRQYGSRKQFSLYPCIYDADQHKKIIGELVDSIMATDFNTSPGYIDPKRRTFVVLRRGGDFAERLAALAPIIKHHSFSDEKEWRLISRPISAMRLDHRPGESMIVPYYKLQIGTDRNFSAIKRIIVGPTPHIELSQRSVSTLLTACKISGRLEISSTIVHSGTGK